MYVWFPVHGQDALIGYSFQFGCSNLSTPLTTDKTIIHNLRRGNGGPDTERSYCVIGPYFTVGQKTWRSEIHLDNQPLKA